MPMVVNARISKEERDELWAASQRSFVDMVQDAYSSPLFAEGMRVLEDDGRLIAIGGLTISRDDVGIPWCITTTEIRKHPVAAYKIMKETLTEWKRHTRYLLNYVDVRNVTAIRFLDHLGFKWAKGHIFERGDTLFQGFIMKGDMP